MKGTLIVTLTRFLAAHGVPVQSVAARLPASDQAALREILLPSGWYPADMFARLVDAATALAPIADKGTCLVEMGKFSAQTNLGPGGLRRAYIRENDPHHVLSAISRIYKNVYSSGERTYQRTGERSAIVRGHGTRLAQDQCLWVAGWLQRVVELSGGTSVRVLEVQCEGARAAPHCEYRVQWEGPLPATPG